MTRSANAPNSHKKAWSGVGTRVAKHTLMKRISRLSSFSHRAVAHAFEAIVLAAATAGACATVACGGGTAGTTNGAGAGSLDGGAGTDGGGDGGIPISYDGFTRLQPIESCAKPLALLPGIHPADANASIQQRHVTVSDTFAMDSADGGATDANGCRLGVLTDTLVDAYGAACSNATDEATCKQHVACVTPPGSGWLTSMCSGPCFQTKEGTFYLEVNGNTLSFPTDLDAMLGAIDTPSEAVLIANSLGYLTPTGCTEPFPAAYRVVGDSFELLVLQAQSCGDGLSQLRVRIHPDGSSEVLETSVIKPATMTVCAAGRRPAGFAVPEPGGAARSIVDYLTELAMLEAASIAEFATLRDELRAHGAPRALVDGADRARRDEIDHARVTQRLARSFGGRPGSVAVEPRPQRSIEELALHNAVEGCVRETFGALSATWQARHASHSEIARALARIADDETRHAAFSWELAAWLESRLDAPARGRVAAARAEGFAELSRGQEIAPHDEVTMLAGVPDVATAQHLLAQMAGLFELTPPAAAAA
jgi:hypothetical protein